MRVVELDQRSDEWHRWRASHVTASDIPTIMGSNPWCYPEQLWRQKKGLELPPEINSDMQRGIDLEDEARSAVNFELDTVFEPLVVEHDTDLWAGASLDGFDEETQAILEIKCPRLIGFQKVKKGTIPWMHLYQIYWQMYCSGANKAIYAVYHDGDLHLVHLPPADEDIQLWKTYSQLMRDTPVIHAKALAFHQSLQANVYLT